MPKSAPTWSRRRLLTTGAALVPVGLLGWTGCSPSDPTIVESPRPSPAVSTPTPSVSASPKPNPLFSRAAGAEQGLADLAAALVKRSGITSDQRAYLRFLRDAHTEHAQALAGPVPTERPTTADVVGRPYPIRELSTRKAWRTLSAAQAKLGAAHRRAALDASGPAAALWGSLAVADEAYAAVDPGDPPASAKLRSHRRLARLNDVQATQEMVRQLDAMIYGYQLLLGQLPFASSGQARGRRYLRRRRALRDELAAQLTRARHPVPAAAAAYVPDPSPTSPAKARQLARALETALQPFCGIWLAAAGTDAERSRALTALQVTSRNARAWGAGVRAWPGYAD